MTCLTLNILVYVLFDTFTENTTLCKSLWKCYSPASERPSVVFFLHWISLLISKQWCMGDSSMMSRKSAILGRFVICQQLLIILVCYLPWMESLYVPLSKRAVKLSAGKNNTALPMLLSGLLMYIMCIFTFVGSPERSCRGWCSVWRLE